MRTWRWRSPSAPRAARLGTLRLSFVPSAALDVVPRLLRAFRKDYPDVKLILQGETSAHQLAALGQGSVDVGIVVPPLQDARQLRLKLFGQEDLVLAVPRSPSARAAQAGAAERDLAAEPFVGFPVKEGPGFESVVMAACQDCGFVPNFVQAASRCRRSWPSWRGLGIALVPKAMAAVVMENVDYVPLRRGSASIRYPLGLAWNPENPNPALNAFLAVIERLRPH